MSGFIVIGCLLALALLVTLVADWAEGPRS